MLRSQPEAPYLGDPEDTEYDVEYLSRCPVCGDVIDYCQGHGEIGDPVGWGILENHDAGWHRLCDPRGCDDAER